MRLPLLLIGLLATSSAFAQAASAPATIIADANLTPMTATTAPARSTAEQSRAAIQTILEQEVLNIPANQKQKARLFYLDLKTVAATAAVEFGRYAADTKLYYYHFLQNPENGQWRLVNRDQSPEVRL